jgi:hypothetical protein
VARFIGGSLKFLKKSLLVITLALSAYVGYELIYDDATVTFINKSQFPVARGEIELCRERARIPFIATRDHASVSINIPGDCHYLITITLTNGVTYNLKTGYVTPGMDFSETIHIYDDRLEHVMR